MSHITNYKVLSQELEFARETALSRFPELEDEIYKVFESADELTRFLQSVDKLIEEMRFNQVIKMGENFLCLANIFFSFEPHIQRLFTSPDTLVSWRRSPTDNILQAIESEARLYVEYFRPIVSQDCTDNVSPDEEEALSVLRDQIRDRAAMDDNKDPIRWSDFRQPKEWRRLRKLKTLSNSVNTWPKLRRDNPDDIECESIKSARISFELAQSWGLDLPEFRK